MPTFYRSLDERSIASIIDWRSLESRIIPSDLRRRRKHGIIFISATCFHRAFRNARIEDSIDLLSVPFIILLFIRMGELETCVRGLFSHKSHACFMAQYGDIPRPYISTGRAMRLQNATNSACNLFSYKGMKCVTWTITVTVTFWIHILFVRTWSPFDYYTCAFYGRWHF